MYAITFNIQLTFSLKSIVPEYGADSAKKKEQMSKHLLTATEALARPNYLDVAEGLKLFSTEMVRIKMKEST